MSVASSGIAVSAAPTTSDSGTSLPSQARESPNGWNSSSWNSQTVPPTGTARIRRAIPRPGRTRRRRGPPAGAPSPVRASSVPEPLMNAPSATHAAHSARANTRSLRQWPTGGGVIIHARGEDPAERHGGVQQGTGAYGDARAPDRERRSDVLPAASAPQTRHQRAERGDPVAGPA